MNHLIHRCLMLIMCCLLTAGNISAQNDSIPQATAADKYETFKPLQLVVPTTLIAVGAICIHRGIFPSENRINIDDYIQYLPVAANFGLGLLGVKGAHPWRERIALTATSYAVMLALSQGLKYTVREQRPDSDARNSFPSGHTATAFTGAELVRREYGNAYGLAAYGIATAVAFLRVYNHRHWLNDVIGGAGIGLLSVQCAYWLLPLERRLFRWDKTDAHLTIVPAYNGHQVSLTGSVTF